MKSEIKHILVALDGSDASKKGLDRAIYIAKLTGAKITGVTVIVVHPTLAGTVINYKKFLTEKSEKMLESTKKDCEKQKVPFMYKILYGKPSSQISGFASKEKVDLVVIGSKGIGGFKGTILGSISNSVAQKSKVSVLVVK
ncbi:MAG: universal stress protein [Nitrosopumilus sp.]|nr:universal stress protein [Nitrosopumilus sp.]MDH3822870.1 universal stress protein [Nitrosopumilus sp.]MDH3833321.1 universal stress protein [Nitrosopumilus sp.]